VFINEIVSVYIVKVIYFDYRIFIELVKFTFIYAYMIVVSRNYVLCSSYRAYNNGATHESIDIGYYDARPWSSNSILI